MSREINLKFVKSYCCKKGIYRKAKYDFRCTNCDAEQILYLVILADILSEENEVKAHNDGDD